MKHFLLFTLTIVFLSTLSAQSNFYVSTDFSAKKGVGYDKEISPAVSIRNLSNESLTLTWEIEDMDLAQDWTFNVCDRKCYSEYYPQKSFTLAPKEVIHDFRVIFRPNGKVGESNLTLSFYENDKKSNIQSVNFSADNYTVTDFPNENSLKIFPNPATQYIQLKDNQGVIDKLVIISALGGSTRLTYKVTNDSENYDISSLQRGIYLVRMLNAEGQIIRTQKISKYNP